ncbi:MAG TPA: hypothetical protein VGJ73_11320 [Verrucomicrobiae bacterium]|jgi:hypothetical protein
MNEETESFEERLRRQSLRLVPAEWRKEILKAASTTEFARQSEPAARRSFLSNLNRRLASVFWPHPVAWAGLAAIWIFIFAVDYSSLDAQPVVAEKIGPPSPEAVAELREQHRLFVELAGVNDSTDADRQKAVAPKPRSERVGWLTA